MRQRLRAASLFALKHLSISALIALCCAALVFLVWYPPPYSRLAGGRDLFLLVVSVDVVMGPMLSLVIYNPAKPRRELWRDIGIVVALQLAALGYGLHSVAQARPVWLAFEGDRFRVVAVPDIDLSDLENAAPEFKGLTWGGPETIGVRLLKGTDPGFLDSVKLAMEGVHPAFRPSRWVSYDSQRQQVIQAAKPVRLLKRARPEQAKMIADAVRKAGLDESRTGYLPLLSHRSADWVVLIDLADGTPFSLLPIDGWH